MVVRSYTELSMQAMPLCNFSKHKFKMHVVLVLMFVLENYCGEFLLERGQLG